MSHPAPLPVNELQRLAALHALDVLDTEPERVFDSLASTAAALCDAPIALVSLVDEHRQWFKAKVGLHIRELPREIAFCAHVVAAGELLEVGDALLDERFADNPLVTGPPDIQFYAGAPIRLADGSILGSLCVIDHVPRTLSNTQRLALSWLADVATAEVVRGDLARSRGQLQTTLDSIGDAVITTDPYGRVQWMNPVAERTTGWLMDDAVGKPLSAVFVIVDDATRTFAADPVDLCLARESTVDVVEHVTLIARTGRESAIACSASPIREADGRVLGAVLTFRDVSEQRRLTSEMSHRAMHDFLTGLPNRTAFEGRLASLLATIPHDGREHVLLFIDLDQFKVVNDACGHAAGDQLLCQISGIVRTCVRTHDTLARLGGDEFGLLLEDCDPARAQIVAQKICDQMEQFRFVHEGRRFRVGASIGLVPFDARWPSVTAALQAADASCYAAKEEGRNRVHVWRDSDRALEARQGEMHWVSRIELALDEDRFELYAQRITPIAKEEAGLHFEVLLRMRDAGGALSLPGGFLPVAERFHLATRLDRWVVRKSFDWMATAERAGVDIELMAINLSGHSLVDRAFHRDIGEMIRSAPFDVRRLCFEITETAAITHLADARAFIDDVRGLGVKIALDDFGAGASSFGYLKTLPVDFIKIDGHFVANLLHDQIDHAAVRCFCEIAKVMGVKTIAEFVEDDAVRDELRAIGVDMAQGFLVHRPEPIADLFLKVSADVRPFMTAADLDDDTPSRIVREIAVDVATPNRLNLADPAEVLLWADDLGISVEDLCAIVAKVGPMRAAIRFYASTSSRVLARA